MVGASRINDNHFNSLLAVRFTLLPSAGMLTDNGVAVALHQSVSVADIIRGMLLFTPKANLTGGPYFVCKFQVQDNGGATNGGLDLDPIPKVLDITIQKTN